MTLVSIANQMLSALGMAELEMPFSFSRADCLREAWEANAFEGRSRVSKTPLRYSAGMCFLNAEWNRTHAYADLDLRIVFGTLSLNGWDEYGGRSWSDADWEDAHKGELFWDAHAWLEDEKGNVYDYCFDRYLEIAEMRTGRIGRMFEGTMEKVSKVGCLKRGLTYTPAPAHIQRMMKDEFVREGLMRA